LPDTAPAGRDDVAARIHAYLEERRDDMVDLLSRLVLSESPTLVPESQRGVQSILGEALTDIGYEVEHLPGEMTGGQLHVGEPGRRGGPYQLLVGHSDTVWPLGTLERMPLEVENGQLRGPGSFDMKGGLVQIVFALQALRRLDLRPTVAPTVFVNSDEEIGSPESKAHLERLAADADRALILEPAMGPKGLIKTARKGISRYTLRVRGRSAHAGLDPERGASAIRELAQQIEIIYALNSPHEGVTVNVGVISGGSLSNIVAADARAEIDVRVLSDEQAARVDRALHSLQPVTPGVNLELSGGQEASPLERTPRNRALWAAVQRAGRLVGLELGETIAGGASDGNTTSVFTATVDGLGTLGDGAHADHEYVDIATMPERAAVLALVLLEPPLGNG
jgi:glutamate carboxypeptidase